MKNFPNTPHPLAITMWDFSWLERRWPGAGYEDWDLALDELLERGYNAVRIDVFPHLIASAPERIWELIPHWNTQEWGSPTRIRVQVWPQLRDFMEKCAARKIKVGLSTWYRQDTTDARRHIADAATQARQWIETLRLITDAGLADSILYVDLCNEWPMLQWSPFFTQTPGKNEWDAMTPASLAWMQTAIGLVRTAYPQFAYCYSGWGVEPRSAASPELGFLNLLEPHIWLAQQRGYYQRVGYGYERFDAKGYENVVAHAEAVYRANPEYWLDGLRDAITRVADSSSTWNLPLITTECWGLVDYKDWPGLDWGYVKEMCAVGTTSAAATGRWVALATSNFCGPQFRGMWRDIAWHQRLTKMIKASRLPEL